MPGPEGFREYVVARQSALLRAAYLLSGDRHTAEDLVQTSLTKVWLRWSHVSQAGNVDAYVHRVLVNAYISSTRRRWWGERPSGDQLPDRAGPEPYSGWTERDVLLGAIRQLPPRQRAVITLRFFLDQTEATTAETLGCSVGTVKSQTARALGKLREHLAPESVPAIAENA
jgi:RNA polymerase sigma-70 factor (sigma-E family)